MEVRWLIGIVLVLSVTAVNAEPACTVSPQKKQVIEQMLCGHGAVDPEYRFHGPGCVERSSKIRMQDSAAQVVNYRLCGDDDFARRLLAANRYVANFVQSLVPCTDERVDIERLFQNAVDTASETTAGSQCGSALRARLDQRRPFFEQQILQTEKGGINEAVYDSLRIAVDADGNIADR
jgi:hypothetical protein